VFARNAWYVAAASAEITSSPLARTIVGEPVVLYRTSSGAPTALADRCPHRRFPLSLGRLVDDVLVCGYHGFSFDCAGTCVAVPGQNTIPRNAHVRRYPLVERGAWVFIWMGPPDQVDPVRLPRTPWLEDEGWTVISGMAPLAARYQLLVDNLLDLSHETYLHAGYIGTPEVAATPARTAFDEDALVVGISRHMDSVECPPFYAESTGLASPVDRWQDIQYHLPGIYILHSRLAPAGLAPDDDGSDPGASHAKILYGITPSTARSSYVFWLVARDFAVGDDGVSEFLIKMQDEVVRQDVDALSILEERITHDPDPHEVHVRIDGGALAARRLLRKLIADESSTVIAPV